MCQQRKGTIQIFHLLCDLAGRVKHLRPRIVGLALILPFNLFLWVGSDILIDTKRSETKGIEFPRPPEILEQSELRFMLAKQQQIFSKTLQISEISLRCSILELNLRFWSQSRQQSTSQ